MADIIQAASRILWVLEQSERVGEFVVLPHPRDIERRFSVSPIAARRYIKAAIKVLLDTPVPSRGPVGGFDAASRMYSGDLVEDPDLIHVAGLKVGVRLSALYQLPPRAVQSSLGPVALTVRRVRRAKICTFEDALELSELLGIGVAEILDPDRRSPVILSVVRSLEG